VVKAVRVVIVHVPKSNKGHPPIAKTCFLAPLSLLFLTLTFNIYSKQYSPRGLLVLYFKSLPFFIVLNRHIIRLIIIIIIRIKTKIVIIVASLITGAIF